MEGKGGKENEVGVGGVKIRDPLYNIKDIIATIKDRKGVTRLREIGDTEQEWSAVWQSLKEKADNFLSNIKNAEPSEGEFKRAYEEIPDMYDLIDQLVTGIDDGKFPTGQSKAVKAKLIDLREAIEEIDGVMSGHLE